MGDVKSGTDPDECDKDTPPERRRWPLYIGPEDHEWPGDEKGIDADRPTTQARIKSNQWGLQMSLKNNNRTNQDRPNPIITDTQFIRPGFLDPYLIKTIQSV